jgi:8-oxo-dGTP pyrophosphatase MutT (NUDIX family)
MPTGSDAVRQAAAIPIRNGQLCLVKSSSGKRWVVPKGCLEPGKSAGEIALQEAWEEAGLVGTIQREPVGTYIYEKFGQSYLVLVFLMRVTEAAEQWPEVNLRQRVWLQPELALARIDDAGLREIIRGAVSREQLEVG